MGFVLLPLVLLVGRRAGKGRGGNASGEAAGARHERGGARRKCGATERGRLAVIAVVLLVRTILIARR
jgi:hypothetical protein